MSNTENANILQRALATSETREIQARSYWQVASLVFGAFSALILGKILLGMTPATAPTHVVAYLALAAIGAYVGYKGTHAPGRTLSMEMTRVYGVLGVATVTLAAMGTLFAGVFNSVELALLSATSAVALYVGFSPQ